MKISHSSVFSNSKSSSLKQVQTLLLQSEFHSIHWQLSSAASHHWQLHSTYSSDDFLMNITSGPPSQVSPWFFLPSIRVEHAQKLPLLENYPFLLQQMTFASPVFSISGLPTITRAKLIGKNYLSWAAYIELKFLG